MSTVDQQGLAPTSKVSAAGAGGAAGIVIVFIAGQFGLDVSPEVAAAITTLIALVAGYFKRESATPALGGQRGYSLVELLAVLFIAVLFIAVLLLLVLLAVLDRL